MRVQVPQAPPHFKKGCVYFMKRKFPVLYTVVDVAVFDGRLNAVLLGQKKRDNGKWRFPGGFADPLHDFSFEDTANRELAEEVLNLKTTRPIRASDYVASRLIEDCRYRNHDKLCSMLYMVEYSHGIAYVGDDLNKVKWFSLSEKHLPKIIPNHREHFKEIIAYKEFLDSIFV